MGANIFSLYDSVAAHTLPHNLAVFGYGASIRPELKAIIMILVLEDSDNHAGDNIVTVVHALRLPVVRHASAASSSTASSSSSVALAAHSMTAACARGDLDKQAKGPAGPGARPTGFSN